MIRQAEILGGLIPDYGYQGGPIGPRTPFEPPGLDFFSKRGLKQPDQGMLDAAPGDDVYKILEMLQEPDSKARIFKALTEKPKSYEHSQFQMDLSDLVSRALRLQKLQEPSG